MPGTRHRPGMQDACMTVDPLRTSPVTAAMACPLVLVHGLMGRGSTWSRQLPWLKRLGTVYTYDAPWHRGRDVLDPHPISTERFVEDLADAVGTLGTPVSLIGHSMGGLHSWCLAARPARVGGGRGGRGHGARLPRPHHRALGTVGACAAGGVPTEQAVFDEFGPIAGRYFVGGIRPDNNGLAVARPSRTLGPDRRRVGHPGLLAAVAGGPGAGAADRGRQLGHPARADARDARNWLGTTYLHVPGAGHLVHDDAPQIYRDAVEALLSVVRPAHLSPASWVVLEAGADRVDIVFRCGAGRRRRRTAGRPSGRRSGTGRYASAGNRRDAPGRRGWPPVRTGPAEPRTEAGSSVHHSWQ